MHLLFSIHKAQTGQRGRKLHLAEMVGAVAVEVAEHALELLELDGRQVRHVAGHELVFKEGELLGDGRGDEGEFVGKLVVGVGREVVLFDVSLGAARVEGGDGVEVFGEGGQVGVEPLDVE